MIKNILWVEDFDNNDSGVYDPDYYQNQVKKQFGEKYSERVDLHRKVYYVDEDNDGNEIIRENLLQYIDDHIMDIDCVVLDINLKNGIPENVKVFNKMALLFEHGRVVLPKSENSKNDYNMDEIKKKAGFYIYLYLWMQRFPCCDRIFIYTAYDKDNCFEETRKLFEESGITFPDYISKNGDGEYICAKKIDEKALYSGENVYYCVRNIVFSAIEEYKKILDPENGRGEDALKAFNDNMQKKIKKDQLVDIFDGIKRIFYQNPPSKQGNVYRSVLKSISEPFESKWKYPKADDELFTYQRIMKIFRNWSAHNKFVSEAAFPDENEFLIFFILAMRSYFGIEDGCFDFEKAAFDLIGHSSVNFCEHDKYRQTYLFISDLYKFKDDTYKKSKNQKEVTELSLDYIEFLDTKKGWNKDPICKYSDLFKGLWVWRYGLYIDFIEEKRLESGPTMPIYLKQKNKTKRSSFCDDLMNAIEKILFDVREINVNCHNYRQRD